MQRRDRADYSMKSYKIMIKAHRTPTEYEIRLSRNCYYVCLAAGAFFALAGLVLEVLDIKLNEIISTPCVLYAYFKLYCPGCGGTRAVMNLMHGHLLESLWYHPLVPYTATVAGAFIVTHTLNIITKGKVKGMLFRPIYLYIAVGIVAVNWAVKDLLILLFGIYIIG